MFIAMPGVAVAVGIGINIIKQLSRITVQDVVIMAVWTMNLVR